MPPKTEEIVATFLAEKHRFANADGDVAIITAWCNSSINDEISIKVQCDHDELKRGQTYTFHGEWTKYKNRRTKQSEDQFVASSFAMQVPVSREAVIKYIADAGAGHGVSIRSATYLWEAFKENAVKKVRQEPEEAAGFLRLRGIHVSDTDVKQIAETLIRQEATENCLIRVSGLLAGYKFRKTLAKQVVRDIGATAAEDIAANPFILLPYSGCGFRKCDAMWMGLKLPAASIERQAYCAWDAINRDRNGSTWIPRTVAECAIAEKIGSAELKKDEAIALAIEKGMLVECKTRGVTGPIADDGNISWLALKSSHEDEIELARMLVDAMTEPHCWPDVSTIENIDGEQPQQLSLALRGSVAILVGRPGTGKTFVAANLIRRLLEVFGFGNVGIGAPTNAAARRLSTVMELNRVSARARTNHSLLGRPDVKGQKWHHNESRPFPFKVLVFDEESMKDPSIACSIFRARAKGTMVLMLGDTCQLPSVDRGAWLFNLIQAGLPHGELKEIRRNSGGIVEACAAIAEGREFKPGDNLQVIEVDGENEQTEAVVRSLHECKSTGLDPVWDSRVITAKNITRHHFNKVLQGEFNPNPAIEGCAFRIGDKVIHRETGKDYKIVSVDRGDEDVELNESGDSCRVTNGELGEVLEILPYNNGQAGRLTIKMLDPTRVIHVPLGKFIETKDDGDDEEDGRKTNTGCAFDLAYCVTFHSSQGSEFPWAICVASTRDVRMGYRELPYTGFSRAKMQCVAIGTMAVWNRFCKRVALKERKTFLRERILIEQAKRELELL